MHCREIDFCSKLNYNETMNRLKIFDIAIRNLRSRYVRTLLLLSVVAVISGTLLGASIFISGMKNALKTGMLRLGADVLVVPEKSEFQAKAALLAGEPSIFYMDRSLFEKISRIDGVKRASPQLFVQPTSFTCCYNAETFLVAFEPETDFTINSWLEKNLKKPLSGNEVITGKGVAVIAGDSMPFFGTLFTVKGILEPTGMKFFDQSVFMTMAAAYAMAENSKTKSKQPLELQKDHISAVLVQVQEGFRPEAVAIKIEHQLSGVRAMASDEVIRTVKTQLGGLTKGIIAISVLIWIISLTMIGFSFYMIINERQRELGLLRAMGARRSHIFRLIVTEALIISASGGATGAATGASFIYVFKDMIIEGLKLPYLLPPAIVLSLLITGTIIFSVITGLLSSILPAVYASRMEPYEAIRKGE